MSEQLNFSPRLYLWALSADNGQLPAASPQELYTEFVDSLNEYYGAGRNRIPYWNMSADLEDIHEVLSDALGQGKKGFIRTLPAYSTSHLLS